MLHILHVYTVLDTFTIILYPVYHKQYFALMLYTRARAYDAPWRLRCLSRRYIVEMLYILYVYTVLYTYTIILPVLYDKRILNYTRMLHFHTVYYERILRFKTVC